MQLTVWTKSTKTVTLPIVIQGAISCQGQTPLCPLDTNNNWYWSFASWDGNYSASSINPVWQKKAVNFFRANDTVNEYVIILALPKTDTATVWFDDFEIAAKPVSVQPEIADARVVSGMTVDGGKVVFARPTNYSVKLIAPSGKVVANYSGFGKTCIVDRKSLTPGSYLVSASTAEGTITGRLFSY